MKEEGYIDRTAVVDEHATIGLHTRIWQFCNILAGAVIGNGCNIGQGCFMEGKVRIGNHVTIKNNVSLYDGLICEDDVFLGPNCVFTNVRFPRSFVSRKNEFEETVIEKGATIGANATIICGVRVGRYSMVGAGSVVTKDVNPYTLVVGNPARKMGYVCKCGERLPIGNEDKDRQITCKRCSELFKYTGDSIIHLER